MNRNIYGPMYNPAAVAITGGTISGVTISDSTINQKFTTSTNPASSVATTTAIVDAYNGVVITTNVNNTQTIANPTTAANIKIFTVINNDTSSSNQTIKAHGVDFVLTPGEGQSFLWDGSAWGPTDLGITSLPVPVIQGGTGLATITDHGIMLGSGTTAITPLGVATDGQIPIGSSGADPVLAAITPGDGIDVTNAAGAITIAVDLKANGGLVIDTTELAVDLGASAITGTLAVGDGGSGATTLTDHGVLLGSGTDPITALGVMTNGQLVIGSTGADPVLAALTEGEAIDVTNAAGSITIACKDASTSNKGVTVYSGSTKALAGTDTASAMTPADVAAKDAQERTMGTTNVVEDLSYLPPVTFTWDPGSLDDGVGETSSAITVPGATLGGVAVQAIAPYDLQGITLNAWCDATNSCKARLQNETGGTIDLASGTWVMQARRI